MVELKVVDSSIAAVVVVGGAMRFCILLSEFGKPKRIAWSWSSRRAALILSLNSLLLKLILRSLKKNISISAYMSLINTRYKVLNSVSRLELAIGGCRHHSIDNSDAELKNVD